MAANPAPSRPGAVLFACNFNRVRSPMAEALLKRLVGDRIYVDSCGVAYPPLEAEELGGVDPFVAAVMAEVGCDLTGHRVKTFEDLEDNSFDLVVSLTPQSQQRAVERARGRAAELEYWPILDPTVVEGAREARLAAYREVRDALAARIAQRFAG
jgi:protein-tyrosine-phosphatase